MAEPVSEEGAKHFESSRKVNSDDGWISPAGLFYSCTAEEHDLAAQDLLETHKAHIVQQLKKNRDYEVLDNLSNLPPRVILKGAGYALLSNGLLAEQNLPSSLTSRQLELMQQNKLVFTPESGRLQPAVYSEFKQRLQNEPKVTEAISSLKYDDLGDNVLNFQSFIEDPTETLGLYDANGVSGEIFDALTVGSTAEITLKLPVRRETIKWRCVNLPSAGEVFVQFNHHEHYNNDPDYMADQEDWYALVSKKDINDFLSGLNEKGRSSGRSYRPSGDLEAIDNDY